MLNLKVVRSLTLTASVCAWAGVTIPSAYAVESQTALSTNPETGLSEISTLSETLLETDLQTGESVSEPSMSQVTSVSQLSDVRPTDWAFQALQSLVERYGCIVGYPDLTYRGNRALTRYEFAAGLNACLDRVNELIAASTADLVKRRSCHSKKPARAICC